MTWKTWPRGPTFRKLTYWLRDIDGLENIFFCFFWTHNAIKVQERVHRLQKLIIDYSTIVPQQEFFCRPLYLQSIWSPAPALDSMIAYACSKLCGLTLSCHIPRHTDKAPVIKRDKGSYRELRQVKKCLRLSWKAIWVWKCSWNVPDNLKRGLKVETVIFN